MTVFEDDDIKMIDEWFDSHSKHDTYRSADEYSVGHGDMEAFDEFLNNAFPTLVCISCYFGSGDGGIWFRERNLKNAKFL